MRASHFRSTLLAIVALAAISSFFGARFTDVIAPLSVTRVNNLEITGTTDATGVITARAGVRLTTPTTGPILLSGSGSPNGSVSATQGSLFLRTDTATLYTNTNGAMAWTQVDAGGGTVTSITFGGGLTATTNPITTSGTASIANADNGDITVSAGGTTWTIDNAAVTLAKMANLAENTVIGRANGAGTGVPQALTAAQLAGVVGVTDFMFGGGIDGNLNFDGVNPVKGTAPVANVYTLAGDILANDMTIASGVTVKTSSRMIFVQGTLSGTGKVQWNGNAGVSAGAGGAALAASVTPGAGAGTSYTGVGTCSAVASNATAYYWCTDNTANNGGGTSNTVLNTGTNGTACRGGGGGGSSGGVPSNQGGGVTRAGGTYPNPGYEIFAFPQLGWTGRRSISGGFGGAGIFDNQSGGGCGVGAGGGSGGGWIYMMVKDCGTGSITVEAKGGAGGSNAQTCAVCNAGGQCQCSGGGGGPGGTIFLFCGKGTLPTTDNAPGAAGARSTGMDVCRNAACAPATGAGACCAGDGGKGGTGMKNLYSPSTGWTHTADP